MQTGQEKLLRLPKAYAEAGGAPGVVFYDTTGRAGVRIGAAIGKGKFAGVVFYNEDQTEAGGVIHNGRREPDGRIRAASVITMDQFKSDEVVRLTYDQQGEAASSLDLGRASIAFLDPTGRVVRTITP